MAWSRIESTSLSKNAWNLFLRTLMLCVVLTMAACSVIGDITSVEEVKPWQRGVLARDHMQMIPDALQQTVDDHIYFSREGSTGGVSVQGGGCGCN